MILKCCCCNRQIIRGIGKGDSIVTYGPCIYMGTNTFACAECAKDLDENGLFPEEK